MSFATILIPGSGVAAAYTNTNEFHNALGIYLITWFIVTFLLLFVFSSHRFTSLDKLICYYNNSIAALRKNVAFVALFACLSTTFILLAVANFTGKTSYVSFFLSLFLVFLRMTTK